MLGIGFERSRVDAGRKRGAVGGAAAGSGSGASSPLELSEDDDNEPLPK